MHTYAQFLKTSVGLGLLCMFRFRFGVFRFSILLFFWFSLENFVFVLFACVVLGVVSLVLCQEIGWEDRLQSDLFCVAWDVKR